MIASVSSFTVKSTLCLFSAYQYSSMNTSWIFFSDEDLVFMSLSHLLLIALYANTSRHYDTKDNYAAPFGCQTI